MTKLLPPNGGNSYIDIIRKMKLLLPYGNNVPLDSAREAQRLLSFLNSIFSSRTTGAVFLYLLERGATTSWLLQVHLEIPETTAYRVLKRLRSMGLVTPENRLTKKRRAKGGPRPIIWALLDATQEDVARAARDHNRAMSPNYRVAEGLVQYLLEECRLEDFTHKKLLLYGNERLDMSRQRVHDVVQLAAVILVEKGYKVWR